MLQAGDLVPHFEVETLDGRHVRYADVWQRRNLLLVRLGDGPSADADAYAAALAAQAPACDAHDAVCIITRDPVPGLGRLAVVIADRWGEVVFAAHADGPADLPSAGSLLEWLGHVQQRCPECEGEAR